MIEPLPEGHAHTCDKVRTHGGWSRDISDPNRCGKTAVVIDRQSCGCGACDMSCYLCDYHARRSGTDAEAREDHENWCDATAKSIAAWPDSDRKTEVLARIAEMRRAGPVRFDHIVASDANRSSSSEAAQEP